jgi:hypothetical protein
MKMEMDKNGDESRRKKCNNDTELPSSLRFLLFQALVNNIKKKYSPWNLIHERVSE